MLVPEGTYIARIERASLMKSLEKKTQFYDAVCVITEEGPCKGARVPWAGWLTDTRAEKTFKTLVQSGCTFPDDNYADLIGLGTHEQEIEVEHEPPFMPTPTEANPDPKPIVRARVKWVNPLTRGTVGDPLNESETKAFGASFKATLHRAKTGGRATEASADGSRVSEGGTLKSKTGKDMF